MAISTTIFRSKTQLRLFLLILFCLFQTNFVQSQRLSDSAKVSVLTCGSGDQLYSIFGHTALRVYDPEKNIDIIYNYGTFDFSTPNFYLKFIKGDLQYFVSTSSFEHFLYAYEIENRDVFEQELNFTQQQKQQIFDQINSSLFTEQRFYTYKFIDKNCTTMVADQINAVLGQEVVTKTGNLKESYRHVLNPYLSNLFFEKLGINIIFGYRTDQMATQLFLPDELMQSLESAQKDGELIATKTETHFLHNPDLFKKSGWNNIYIFIAFLGLIILSRKNSIYLSFLILSGLLGTFLIYVGFYSEHREVLWNYNTMMFNPVLLLLVYYFIRRNKSGFKNTLTFTFVVLGIYILFLMNKSHFIIMLPLIITHILILLLLYKKLRLLPAVE